MEKSYKIAFTALDAFGHVNACIGLAQALTSIGHKCVFIVNQTWKGRLSCYGFEEEIFIDETKLGKKPSQHLNEFMRDAADYLRLSPFDKIRQFEAPGWAPLTEEVKYMEPLIKDIIDRIKPDAIVTDTFVTIPAVVSAGIPWIDLISCNQLFYVDDERLPPGGSGYATDSDRKLWTEFREEAIDAYDKDWNEFNEWVQSKGTEPLEHRGKFSYSSPYLNLYLCPDELDYTDIRPKPKNWFNIDCLMRSELENQTEIFEIPEKLNGKPGKLIYLSMGTMCSSELNLMKRLISILSKSKNKFIVSKGPSGDEYELFDNMWGQNSVNQTQVLPMVDLVITHGGNNTITETLYFGKPMIVLPVFSDQYDSSQRVVEKKLGLSLDPYHCRDDELLNAINVILNDFELKSRLRNISNRIKTSKSKLNAAKLIEKLVNEHKKINNNNNNNKLC